jgi:probable addiction module antidote protein
MNARKWDMAEHIKTKEEVAAYLKAALEEDDPEILLATLGDIARSEGMSKIARELGVARESLYISLSPNGNPSFTTVYNLIHIMGFRMDILPSA